MVVFKIKTWTEIAYPLVLRLLTTVMESVSPQSAVTTGPGKVPVCVLVDVESILIPDRGCRDYGNNHTVNEHNQILDLAIGAKPVRLLSHNEGVLEIC
jgi:hypothetical protein